MSIKDLKSLITVINELLKSTEASSDKFKELVRLYKLLTDILKESQRELKNV